MSIATEVDSKFWDTLEIEEEILWDKTRNEH
jgi:hypothetical protein